MAPPSTGVRVAVRSRPMSKREISLGSSACLEIDQSNSQVALADKKKNPDKPPRAFTFDFAYGTESTQDGVYQDIGAPVAERALDGWNGTVFAYGQTGSGKTWTMQGGATPETEGLVPRLVKDLMGKIEAEKATASEEKTVDFQVTCSYVEIYNEVIHDLLNPSSKALTIRESPDAGVYIQGVSEVVCHDSGAIMQLLAQGASVRRVAETQMNSESSRSHSVLTLTVGRRTVEKTEEKTREVMLSSRVNLVDLAGSERADKTGATGATLKEGAAINKSLMTLGAVINALGELSKGKKVHVPYRDSKLTRLLQESLGGNSSTLMVAALSPADYNHDETLTTLQYAQRVKMVENKVVKNEDVQEKMIRELKEELEKLRAQIAAGGGAPGQSFDADAGPDPEMVRKLHELESGASTAFAEKERMSKALEEERAKNMSVTIGSVMENAKEKKMDAMKKIKKLQNEKSRNHEKQKQKKEKYGELKKKLEKQVEHYKTVSVDFEKMEDGDQKDKLEEDLAKLLDHIEKNRGKLVQSRDDLEKLKLNSEKLEEELIEMRAELVANADLLDQNDALRKKIVEEERAK
ncbi:hypothetical protein TeGR_g5532, partial [Tetraparma gracilis]